MFSIVFVTSLQNCLFGMAEFVVIEGGGDVGWVGDRKLKIDLNIE